MVFRPTYFGLLSLLEMSLSEFHKSKTSKSKVAVSEISKADAAAPSLNSELVLSPQHRIICLKKFLSTSQHLQRFASFAIKSGEQRFRECHQMKKRSDLNSKSHNKQSSSILLVFFHDGKEN